MEPIKLGFLTLYPFGLLMILPALGALLLAARSMGKAGLKKETAERRRLPAVGRAGRRYAGGMADRQNHEAAGN